WPAVHMGDMLRLGVLWKMGGLYSDSDTICMRSVEGITNMVALGRPGHVNNHIMHFDKHHPFLDICMKSYAKSYKATCYLSGVKALHSMTQQSCNIDVDKWEKNITASQPYPCPGFKVYPQKAFNPIPYKEGAQLFKLGKKDDFDKMFKESYV
ncbi:unnamed protein product, partial [Meganyctiphanes norvegica]